MYISDDNTDFKSIDNGRVKKPFEESAYELFYDKYICWAVFKKKVLVARSLDSFRKQIILYLEDL
jgi:hypothetical protein